MNKVVLIGRLARDPEVRYSQNDTSMAIARFSLAVDRRGRSNNQDGQTADHVGRFPIYVSEDSLFPEDGSLFGRYVTKKK